MGHYCTYAVRYQPLSVASGFLMVCFLSLAFVVLGLVSGGALGYYMYVLFLHYISSPVLINGYTIVFCLRAESVLISRKAGTAARGYGQTMT